MTSVDTASVRSDGAPMFFNLINLQGIENGDYSLSSAAFMNFEIKGLTLGKVGSDRTCDSMRAGISGRAPGLRICPCGKPRYQEVLEHLGLV